MQETTQYESFENLLIAQAGMCYSVALVLTRNPRGAEELAKFAMTQTWRQCGSGCTEREIKSQLLKILRDRFLEKDIQIGNGFGEMTTVETS